MQYCLFRAPSREQVKRTAPTPSHPSGRLSKIEAIPGWLLSLWKCKKKERNRQDTHSRKPQPRAPIGYERPRTQRAASGCVAYVRLTGGTAFFGVRTTLNFSSILTNPRRRRLACQPYSSSSSTRSGFVMLEMQSRIYGKPHHKVMHTAVVSTIPPPPTAVCEPPPSPPLSIVTHPENGALPSLTR